MENQMHGAMPGTATSQISTTPTDKQFATMAAQLAINGHTLIRSVQGDRTIYTCSRWGQSRGFSLWSDVCAFSNQVGGGK